MRYVELILGILAGVAIVNLVFSAPNTANVISASGSALTNLFGTLTRPGGSTIAQSNYISQLAQLGGSGGTFG